MPGLVSSQLYMLGTVDRYTGGTPMPTRWALFCGWENDDARDDFFAGDSLASPFLARAKERWGLSLETVTVVKGQWQDWQPTTEGAKPFAKDEPLIVMTHARVKASYVPTFSWHTAKVARMLDDDPNSIVRMALAEHPLTRSTISVWRSKGTMVRFSYSDGPHDHAQRLSRTDDWLTDDFFARFRPVASFGTWGGDDPLADLT